MKNTLERINIRLNDTEEYINELEEKVVKMTTNEQNKDKKRPLGLLIFTLQGSQKEKREKGPEKIKDKVKILKAAREIQQITYKDLP